jgi:hypothetical protein
MHLDKCSPEPTSEQLIRHLHRTNQIARRAQEFGHHPQNPTLDLPCRSLFVAEQKPIRVHGSIAEREAEITAVHRSFWAN